MCLSRKFNLPVFLALTLVAGCVSHLPPLRAGQMGVISGRETAGLADNAAQSKVLAEAARLTVDHGYRYFVILPAPARSAAGSAAARPTPGALPIRPGLDVSFRPLRNDQAGRPGVFDAYRLLSVTNRTGGAKR
jgi:hypothetical protein